MKTGEEGTGGCEQEGQKAGVLRPRDQRGGSGGPAPGTERRSAPSPGWHGHPSGAIAAAIMALRTGGNILQPTVAQHQALYPGEAECVARAVRHSSGPGIAQFFFQWNSEAALALEGGERRHSGATRYEVNGVGGDGGVFKARPKIEWLGRPVESAVDMILVDSVRVNSGSNELPVAITRAARGYGAIFTSKLQRISGDHDVRDMCHTLTQGPSTSGRPSSWPLRASPAPNP